MGASRKWSVSKCLVAAGVVLGSAQACGDNTSAALRAAQLAQGCSINSDCAHLLVCAFQHCHVECTTDVDCKTTGGRCVRAPEGVGVCQLPSERDCKRDDQCVGAEVCAADNECRDVCSKHQPCIEGQLCSASGECALTTELDAHGDLLTGQGAGGGGGDTGNDGGAGHGGGNGGENAGTGALGGTGGSNGTGAHGGTGGSVEQAGAGEAGSGNTSNGGSNTSSGGTGGSSGGTGGSSGGTGGSSGGTSGNSGTAGMATGGRASGGTSSGGAGQAGQTVVDEHEPNDDRAAPMPFTAGGAVTASFSASTDNDYFEVVTPETDLAGGYYTYTVTDVPDGKIFLTVLSEIDFNPIFGTQTNSTGAANFGYWASAPGQRFLVLMQPRGGTFPFSYKLTVTYAPAVDPREPDDTRQSAKPLELGVPVESLLFAGYTGSAIAAAAYEDWYAVTLNGPKFTATMSHVPADADGAIFLYDSAGVQVAHGYTDNLGADIVLTDDVPAPGSYYFDVQVLNSYPSTAASTTLPNDVPESFRNPYTFTVTEGQ